MQSTGVLNGPLTAREMLDAEAEMIGRAAAQGFVPAVDPEVAEHMAAFREVALDADEADDSRFDGEEA